MQNEKHSLWRYGQNWHGEHGGFGAEFEQNRNGHGGFGGHGSQYGQSRHGGYGSQYEYGGENLSASQSYSTISVERNRRGHDDTGSHGQTHRSAYGNNFPGGSRSHSNSNTGRIHSGDNFDKNHFRGDSGRKPRTSDRKRQVAILIAVFLLIYIPSVYNWLNNANMTTDILRNGILVESISIDAIIVREEEIVESFAEGTLIPLRSEGEKVPANAAIATVYTRSSLELVEELNQKKRTLIESQYERVNKGAAHSREIESIESEIGKHVKGIAPLINKNSLYAAGLGSKDINSLVSKKAELFGDLPTNDAYINQLIREKKALEESVSLNSNGIASPSAGYISYNIDEYESSLTLNNLPGITHDLYSKIVGESRNSYSRALQSGSEVAVKPGSPFSKIVKTNNFYFVINIKDERFEQEFKAGDNVRIRTSNPTREFEGASIIYKSDRTDNGSIYAFKLQQYLFDFIDKRVVNIELIQKYQEGLKLPVSSLIDFSKNLDYAYIAVMQSNKAQIKKVRILASNEEYAIIEAFDDSDRSVSLYSSYIRDPINIEEG